MGDGATDSVDLSVQLEIVQFVASGKPETQADMRIAPTQPRNASRLSLNGEEIQE